MGEVMNKKKKHGQFLDIVKRFLNNKSAVVGLAIFMVIVLLAVFAGAFGTYEECIETNIMEKNKVPSAEHWFGTDNYGRDLFLRCIYGARTSLVIGMVTATICLAIGTTIGMTAGYYGGLYDNLVMRFLDMMSSIPSTLMAICVVSALGDGIPNLILAITMSRFGGFARQARSAVMAQSGQEYVEAARAGGVRDFRILSRHIFPNILSLALVNYTLQVSHIILGIATLSFLGLGIAAPMPEWGAMISAGKGFLRTFPHMVFAPGLCIIATSLSINLIGDGLRDAMDPRLKR